MTFLAKAILKIHENGGKKVNVISKNMKIKVNLVKIMKILKKLMIKFYMSNGRKFHQIKFSIMNKKTLNLNRLNKKLYKNSAY